MVTWLHRQVLHHDQHMQSITLVLGPTTQVPSLALYNSSNRHQVLTTIPQDLEYSSFRCVPRPLGECDTLIDHYLPVYHEINQHDLGVEMSTYVVMEQEAHGTPFTPSTATLSLKGMPLKDLLSSNVSQLLVDGLSLDLGKEGNNQLRGPYKSTSGPHISPRMLYPLTSRREYRLSQDFRSLNRDTSDIRGQSEDRDELRVHSKVLERPEKGT